MLWHEKEKKAVRYQKNKNQYLKVWKILKENFYFSYRSRPLANICIGKVFTVYDITAFRALQATLTGARQTLYLLNVSQIWDNHEIAFHSFLVQWSQMPVLVSKRKSRSKNCKTLANSKWKGLTWHLCSPRCPLLFHYSQKLPLLIFYYYCTTTYSPIIMSIWAA